MVETVQFPESNALLKKIWGETRRAGMSRRTLDREVSFMLESLIDGVRAGGDIRIVYHDSHEQYAKDPTIDESVEVNQTILVRLKRALSRFGMITTEHVRVIPRIFKIDTRTEDSILVTFTNSLQRKEFVR